MSDFGLLEGGDGILLESGGRVDLEGGGVRQTFRKALRAKLLSIDALTSIVGQFVYPGSLPPSHNLTVKGPALTYTVMKSPIRFAKNFAHVLGGSDGTVSALVTLTAWSYQFDDVDQISLALFDALDGIRNADDWGDGTTGILSCIHADELDQPEPDPGGRSALIYRITSTFHVRYRVTLPANAS